MSFHFPDYFLMGNTRASKALPGMSHDEWLVILDRSVQGSQLSPQTSMKSQWFTKHVIPLLVWKASKSQEQEMERNFYGGSLGEAAERVGKSIGWELWNLALCTGFSASRDLTVATFGPFPPVATKVVLKLANHYNHPGNFTKYKFWFCRSGGGGQKSYF